MAKGFVYRGNKRTAEDINRKAKEGTKDYDSIYKAGLPTYKPKEGDNTIRILPSGDPEDPDWDLTVQTHYNVGADNGRYLCLDKMKGESCPVCAVIEKLDDEAERDQIRVGKGCAVWIIDRDNEKAGPQLWSMPFTKVRNEIYARSTDRKTKTPILVDDPDEGFDISFTRKGTGQTTAYSGVEVDRDPTPLHDNEKVQARWLDFISEHPLKDCIQYYDAEHIEKVLMGQSKKKADDDDDDAEAETSRSRRQRESAAEDEEVKPSRRAKRPDPEDDEDDDPPPRRRARAEEEDPPAEDSRAARRRALLDDDDDAEAEPAPKRTRRQLKDDLDDDIPFDKGSGKAKEEAEEGDDDAPVASARRSLERLKSKK